jgi:hypothetical protein
MLSTRDVIRALKEANPAADVSEDSVRVAIRRGKIRTPSTFAGRLAWSRADVAALALALCLTCPPDLVHGIKQ